MDLLTQGLLGGTLALTLARKKDARPAAAIGFLSGMLADADILLHAGDDPLLNVELHRHFTHALIFIPVGALIAALVLWPLLRRRLDLVQIYRYAFLGFAGSGLLDACTSYGTHLLWPFSDTRFAWSIIAIIDPVFSLLLVVGLLVALLTLRPVAARVALGLAGVYLLFGLWQHDNALQAARELAAQRGHVVEDMVVKPTLGNLVLWRSVYLSDERFHVDAIRIGPGPRRVYAGDSLPRFDRERDLPNLGPGSVVARDIERFSRLSEGYVAADPTRDGVLIDVRYSMLPTTVTPMWGIDLDAGLASGHVDFVNYRDRPEAYRERFIAMLLGRDPVR